jgi:hypothetical protein
MPNRNGEFMHDSRKENLERARLTHPGETEGAGTQPLGDI